MATTTATDTMSDVGRDPAAEIAAIAARIRERNPDMADEEWEEFAHRWAEAINERIRARVERVRDASS